MLNRISGTFAATGVSSSQGAYGRYSVSLTGGATATVELQRSLDDGSTWGVVEEFTADAEKIGEEFANSVLYRFECTAYTSGTVTYIMAS